jgi:hypothetical protein
MEELNFCFGKPRVRFIEIDTSHFPEGAYSISFVLKRCVLTDLLQWKIKLGDAACRVSMHPDGLLEVISIWPPVEKQGETVCTPACLELHTALSCILATVFDESMSMKQVYQTAKMFLLSNKTQMMTDVCFGKTQRLLEALLQAENKSWSDIGFARYGVRKLVLDVSELPVSCIAFEICFERGATMERVKVIPSCCLKKQEIELLLCKGTVRIRPINFSRRCEMNCINVSQMLHTVYCKKKPKTLTEVCLLMEEIKVLLFIHGSSMDKLCYDHTLSNMKNMKQIFEQQAVVKKHFLV